MGLNRVLVRRGLVAGTVLSAACMWSGCGEKYATEFVAGISSQVQVPRDLSSISITVSAGGQIAFNTNYPVYDGTVRLPRTLGVVNSSTPEGTPIAITVVGFDGSAAGTIASNNAAQQAQIPTVGQKEAASGQPTGARVLRSFRQPYQPGQILFVPMPLHYSCFDVDCGPQSGNDLTQCSPASDPGGTDTNDPCTCVGGQCVDALNDPTIHPLPVYNDALIYGTTNTCFRPFTSTSAAGDKLPGCMDFGLPPQVIDATNCVYALPNTASVPPDAGAYNPAIPAAFVQAADSGGGLNVRVVFDNYVSEVLDYEGECPPDGPTAPAEGYCTFKGAPQRFMLAPSLCTMVPGAPKPNAFHTISLIEASAACPSKTQFQPICEDANGPPWQPTLADGGSSSDGGCNVAKPLTPAPSALYILWDKSSGMREFFGQEALKQVLSVSLGDPVFNQTQIAFSYTPGPNPPATPGLSDCTAAPGQNSFETPLIPFEPSIKGQADIGNNLLSDGDGGTTFAPGNTPWYLEAALDGTYQALQAQKAASKDVFNRTAVMLFFDRDFATTPPDCGGTHKSAIEEAQAALGAGIETYVVYLKNADDTDAGGNAGPQALSDATALAMGLNPSLKYFFDASQGNASALAATQAEALATIVADLGSCVYEVPQGIGPEAVLQFPDVVSRSLLSVKNATSCDNDDPATTPTWVFDNQHIHVCPNTCQRIIDAVQADQANTAQNNILKGTANAAAGVTVYATEACDAPSAGPIVEASVPNTVDANFGDEDASIGSDDSGSNEADGGEDAGTD